MNDSEVTVAVEQYFSGQLSDFFFVWKDWRVLTNDVLSVLELQGEHVE